MMIDARRTSAILALSVVSVAGSTAATIPLPGAGGDQMPSCRDASSFMISSVPPPIIATLTSR